VKFSLTVCAFLFVFVPISRGVPLWTASNDSTGQYHLTGRSDDGELRIVIKGKEAKVFVLLNALEREAASTFDVSTAFGVKKAKEKWTVSADTTQAGTVGTVLQAPSGNKLLTDFLKATGSTFSIRVAPPGKLGVVGDFSLSGLEDFRSQIQEALTRPPPVPPPATPKPSATPKAPVTPKATPAPR
jgi:hypothetical protein